MTDTQQITLPAITNLTNLVDYFIYMHVRIGVRGDVIAGLMSSPELHIAKSSQQPAQLASLKAWVGSRLLTDVKYTATRLVLNNAPAAGAWMYAYFATGGLEAITDYYANLGVDNGGQPT